MRTRGLERTLQDPEYFGIRLRCSKILNRFAERDPDDPQGIRLTQSQWQDQATWKDDTVVEQQRRASSFFSKVKSQERTTYYCPKMFFLIFWLPSL